MHGEELYDRDGNLVGKWNGERGMFLDCFVVRERTCRNEQAYTHADFLCSECGHKEYYCNECANIPYDYLYCPNCGARIYGVDA